MNDSIPVLFLYSEQMQLGLGHEQSGQIQKLKLGK